MTKSLREKVTAEELATLKRHVQFVEELIQETDLNAAQDYLDTIVGDSRRIAMLLEEGKPNGVRCE